MTRDSFRGNPSSQAATETLSANEKLRGGKSTGTAPFSSTRGKSDVEWSDHSGSTHTPSRYLTTFQRYSATFQRLASTWPFSRLQPFVQKLRSAVFPHRPLGAAGERLAARYLRQQGMKIVAQPFRHRIGEIDIIAVEDRTVVFVEVKTRRSIQKGRPEEAVDDRKQAQIARTALVFLKQHRLLEQRCRFDVISIVWPTDSDSPDITHYRDAFEAAGKWQFFQ